jgi:hypothetical protein
MGEGRTTGYLIIVCGLALLGTTHVSPWFIPMGTVVIAAGLYQVSRGSESPESD